MRTIHVHSISAAALALLVVAGAATAQDTSPALLNSFEVQQLVKRSEPADNERLAAHFTALAERYTAEAARHTAMAHTVVGNPNRNVVTSMSAHSQRLANLNTQSAATLRELAAYHQKLATGSLATPPRDSAGFQGGAGARPPTVHELRAHAAAEAITPSDDHAFEEYLRVLAKRYTAEANEHVAMAQAYRGTRIAQAATHCDHLVTLLRGEAKEATASADVHKQLASVAR